MRIKRKRRRRLAAELFETRYLLSAVPAELGSHADLEMGPRDIFAERSGWEHLDLEDVPGIADLLSSAGLHERDMAFLQNDLGQVLVRGHTSETILDAVVNSVEQDFEQAQPTIPLQRGDYEASVGKASFLDVQPNVYPSLTTLPDLSSIKNLPGFPENASLTVTPINVGGEAGTAVTVWDTSAAGEPPMPWETTLAYEPATTELTTMLADVSEHESDYDYFVDVGEINPTTTSAWDSSGQQSPITKNWRWTETTTQQKDWAVLGQTHGWKLSDANNSFGFTQQSITQQIPQILGQNLDFDLQNGQLSSNQNASVQNATQQDSQSSNFIANGNANGIPLNSNTESPVANLVSNFMAHYSFDAPTVVIDTPIAEHTATLTTLSTPSITISTPVELDTTVSTPAPKHSSVGLPLPRPTLLSPSGIIGQKFHDLETLPPVLSWTPPTIVDRIAEPPTAIFAEPKLTTPELTAPTTTPKLVSPMLTVKPVQEITVPSIASIASPSTSSAVDSTFTPVIETVGPQQQASSFGTFTETIPTDPAIQSMSIPTPTVSIVSLKSAGDFLDGAEITTEFLFPGRETPEFPLELEHVELVDEYVDVGEESRQVRITPAEDDFIDIGNVEDPDLANAFFSSANIQIVLANARERTEIESTNASPASAQEVGTYGSTRRFEAGDFRDTFVPMTNTTTSTTTAPEQEMAQPTDDAVTIAQPLTAKNSVTMVTQLNSFAVVQSDNAVWATQSDATSPQDSNNAESIKLAPTATLQASDLESDDEHPSIQTQLARSSMVGSAVVLFGASYFESRRVRDRIEQSKLKATKRSRKLEQLGCD